MEIQVKYIAVIEYNDRVTKTFKELSFYCDEKKNPSIGDFIKLFESQGFEMEITDFSNMIFQPIDKTKTDFVSAKIVRTFRDYTYNDPNRRRYL